MSSETVNPISATRFADALKSLPIDALHSKAAELTNSIAHLHHSNDQMLPFAEEGDADCKDAMLENLAVINRMRERVGLIKAEVVGRGMPWTADGEDVADGAKVNGAAPTTMTNAAVPRGGLTDEELRRRMAERMGEDEGEGEDEGVHL